MVDVGAGCSIVAEIADAHENGLAAVVVSIAQV